jgi:nucleoside-diphosphate-sugar epimerase
MDKRQGKFTYNVGEIKAITEKQWVQNIASLMNWTGTIIEKDKHDLPQHLQEPFDWQQDMIYDTSKIRQELNYQEMTTSEQALKNTLDWALENPSFLDEKAKC